jgi:hypothetical protein
MLKTLTIWCLSSSEVIMNTIKDSYKQTRHEDDVNQALSVQPWGVDGRKRRYWLIEGQNDTTFRLYRESAHKSKENTWWSLAGTIDELKVVGETLRSEGSQAARRLADRFNAAIPRLEESVEARPPYFARPTLADLFTEAKEEGVPPGSTCCISATRARILHV